MCMRLCVCIVCCCFILVGCPLHKNHSSRWWGGRKVPHQCPSSRKVRCRSWWASSSNGYWGGHACWVSNYALHHSDQLQITTHCNFVPLSFQTIKYYNSLPTLNKNKKQCRPQQVPDPDSAAPKDRPICHHDAGWREARRNILWRGWIKGADWKAKRGCRDAIARSYVPNIYFFGLKHIYFFLFFFPPWRFLFLNFPSPRDLLISVSTLPREFYYMVPPVLERHSAHAL